MKIFGRYLYLELKRSFHIWKKSILKFILVILVLTGGITAMSAAFTQSQVFRQIEVGVVMSDKDAVTQLAVQFISAMKSVRSVCNFRYMDENAAKTGLKEGDLQAVILLPVNFYDDVYTGKNTPAQILFPEQSDLNTEVFRELLADGVSLLQTAEAGIYAAYEIVSEEETVMSRGEIGNDLTEEYMRLALERQKVYDEQIVSPYGKLISVQYYYLAVCLIILLMAGLHMGYLYRKQGRALGQKLALYGLGGWKSTMIKVTVMTISLYVTAFVVYGAGILLTMYTTLELVYWYPLVLGNLLLLCISISAFFHLIFVLTGGGVQSITVLLAVNVSMILAAGLLLPSVYLPDWLEAIGTVLPLHIWMEYMEEILYGHTDAAVVGSICVLTVIELGTGGVVTCRKS